MAMAEKNFKMTDQNPGRGEDGGKPKAGRRIRPAIILFALAIVLVLGASYSIILLTELRTHSSAEKLVSDVVERIDNKMTEVEQAARNEAETVKSRLDDPEALEKLIYDFVSDNAFIYHIRKHGCV